MNTSASSEESKILTAGDEDGIAFARAILGFFFARSALTKSVIMAALNISLHCSSSLDAHETNLKPCYSNAYTNRAVVKRALCVCKRLCFWYCYKRFHSRLVIKWRWRSRLIVQKSICLTP